jgi:hypothetical protein
MSSTKMPQLLANGRKRPTRSGFVSYANALAPNQTASLFRTADQCVFNVSSAFERRQQLSAHRELWLSCGRSAGAVDSKLSSATTMDSAISTYGGGGVGFHCHAAAGDV